MTFTFYYNDQSVSSRLKKVANAKVEMAPIAKKRVNKATPSIAQRFINPQMSQETADEKMIKNSHRLVIERTQNAIMNDSENQMIPIQNIPQNTPQSRAPQIEQMSSSAAAVNWKENGKRVLGLVTNAHAVGRSSKDPTGRMIGTAFNSDNKQMNCYVVCVSKNNDLAFLKVDKQNTSPELYNTTLKNSCCLDNLLSKKSVPLHKRGDAVSIVGYPFGEKSPQIGKGTLSNVEDVMYEYSKRKGVLYSVDVRMNPGNSGGGIYNSKGDLMGLAFEGRQQDNYAIPLSVVAKSFKRYLSDSWANERKNSKCIYLDSPFLGFTTQDMNIPLASHEQRKNPNYAQFSTKQQGSLVKFSLNKDENDIKAGDIILSMDGKPVDFTGSVQLGNHVNIGIDSAAQLLSNDDHKVKFKVLRDNQVMEFDHQMTNYNPISFMIDRKDDTYLNMLGAQFVDTEKDELQSFLQNMNTSAIFAMNALMFGNTSKKRNFVTLNHVYNPEFYQHFNTLTVPTIILKCNDHEVSSPLQLYMTLMRIPEVKGEPFSFTLTDVDGTKHLAEFASKQEFLDMSSRINKESDVQNYDFNISNLNCECSNPRGKLNVSNDLASCLDCKQSFYKIMNNNSSNVILRVYPSKSSVNIPKMTNNVSNVSLLMPNKSSISNLKSNISGNKMHIKLFSLGNEGSTTEDQTGVPITEPQGLREVTINASDADQTASDSNHDINQFITKGSVIKHGGKCVKVEVAPTFISLKPNTDEVEKNFHKVKNHSKDHYAVLIARTTEITDDEEKEKANDLESLVPKGTVINEDNVSLTVEGDYTFIPVKAQERDVNIAGHSVDNNTDHAYVVVIFKVKESDSDQTSKMNVVGSENVVSASLHPEYTENANAGDGNEGSAAENDTEANEKEIAGENDTQKQPEVQNEETNTPVNDAYEGEDEIYGGNAPENDTEAIQAAGEEEDQNEDVDTPAEADNQPANDLDNQPDSLVADVDGTPGAAVDAQNGTEDTNLDAGSSEVNADVGSEAAGEGESAGENGPLDEPKVENEEVTSAENVNSPEGSGEKDVTSAENDNQPESSDEKDVEVGNEEKDIAADVVPLTSAEDDNPPEGSAKEDVSQAEDVNAAEGSDEKDVKPAVENTPDESKVNATDNDPPTTSQDQDENQKESESLFSSTRGTETKMHFVYTPSPLGKLLFTRDRQAY